MQGGGGFGVSANEYSCSHRAQINFGDLTMKSTIFYKTFRMKNILKYVHSEIFQDFLNMQFDKISTDIADFNGNSRKDYPGPGKRGEISRFMGKRKKNQQN